MSPTLSLTCAADVNISIKAPEQPINTPTAFLPVIGSFNINADSSMAKIGMEVVQMEAFPGDVRLNPIVKQHWLHTSPKTAAAPKRSLSRKGTCSDRSYRIRNRDRSDITVIILISAIKLIAIII